MKEKTLIACLALIGCLLFGALWALEEWSPKLEASSSGVIEVPIRTVRDEAVLLSGWKATEGGYEATLAFIDSSGDTPANRRSSGETIYLALPGHSEAVLYIDGMPAPQQTLGSFSFIELEPLKTMELFLESPATARWNGLSRSVFIGGLSPLLEQAQAASLVRMLIVGIDLAALLFSLLLYVRKSTEKYLLAFAAYAIVTLLRVARRAIPALLSNEMLNLIFEFHIWQACTPAGDKTLTSIWLIMVDMLLRYMILRAFFSTVIGPVEYIWPVEGICATALLVSTFAQNPTLLSWLPVAVRFTCPLFELFILLRAYRRGNRSESTPILFAWVCMFAVLVFNRLSEMGVLPTYSIGSRVGLGGIHESLLLLGFMGAIGVRFAGKYVDAERYSLQLKRVNEEQQQVIDRKTQEIQGSYERLRESQRQKDEFLSVMMHNMKTPLFSIRGYSEMASASLAKEPDTAARYLAVVQKNVTQVEEMLRDLSLASRLESKRLRFDPILLDIRGTVERAAEVVRPAAQLRGVSLRVRTPEQPLVCTVDGTYIVQVFENLLDNAIKSCHVDDAVEMRAYRSGGRIRIDVIDTGTGIPSENLPRIFERYRSFRAGAEGGTGLGLSIARDIVEQNGGTIGVCSEEGRGSTFSVVFPAVGSEEGQRG